MINVTQILLVFPSGLANGIEWSRNRAIFLISKIFISDTVGIVKRFVTRSLHRMRHADWLSASRRLSRTSHKYPALVMTVESSSFTPALRVSLTSGSVSVRGTKKWKNSPSLCHLLARTRGRHRIYLRMRQFSGLLRRLIPLQQATWVAI